MTDEQCESDWASQSFVPYTLSQLAYSALYATPIRCVRNPYNGAIDDACEALELPAVGSEAGVAEG